jgi:hypothetical protein
MKPVHTSSSPHANPCQGPFLPACGLDIHSASMTMALTDNLRDLLTVDNRPVFQLIKDNRQIGECRIRSWDDRFVNFDVVLFKSGT